MSHDSPFLNQLFCEKVSGSEPARESVRGRITLVSSCTFLIVVAFYLLASLLAPSQQWPQVKEAMQATLPAVTSVLGTALGFYFGSQKR